MPGGNYYFNNISTCGSTRIIFAGPATIYCYGTLSMSGQAQTYDSLPKNLTIIMCPKPNGSAPGDVSLSGGSALYATIYAPLSAVKVTGGGGIYGSILGKSVDLGGGASVHYDLNLTN